MLSFMLDMIKQEFHNEVILMRLLLAEDERSLSRALVAIFKKNNYETDAVYDGKEALSFLESGHYDAAVLDLMMPGLDGMEVIRRLRAGGSSVPILVLSARSEVDDKVQALDSGANDYLTKPFATQELLARVRAITRSQTPQTTSRMQLGNITLDRASFELSSPEGSFRLANKEYQIMEMLISNPHRLISINSFIEKIWGCENEVEANVVWVYISYLRKKLKALHGNIQIKVSRGVGYTLEEIA